MDATATEMLVVLQNDEIKDGKPVIDLKTKMAVFEMASGWLTKREKMRPKADAEDDGIALMRRMLEDPAKVVERLFGNAQFREALQARGWLPPAPKPPHRPSKAQAKQREDYAERKDELSGQVKADDSELQKMLGASTQ